MSNSNKEEISTYQYFLILVFFADYAKKNI